VITLEQQKQSRQLAGRVTRWHTWPMIHKPSNAEHSARVATLYIEVWGLPRAEVLEYCLKHDWGEFTAGDTPFEAKRLSPGLSANVNDVECIGIERLGTKLPELTAVEWVRFKVCDLLEMYETAWVEFNMGNRYCECSMHSCSTAIRKLYESLEPDDVLKVERWLDHWSDG